MQQPTARDITHLLRAWAGGDRGALDQLTPVVYERLRRMAAHYLRQERQGHTLQPTALVHDAFVRLLAGAEVDWRDRGHFYAVAATVMRRVLVDAARTRLAEKRGAGAIRADHSTAFDLDGLPASGSDAAQTLCDLDDALAALARLDPRRAQVVELRFFGGLTIEETAQVLETSPQTVMRDWKIARAWLARELGAAGTGSTGATS
jgi:RNA polymerase sigma factor (TIGR02999 family)